MKKPLIERIFPFQEPPPKDIRIAVFIVFTLFLWMDLSVVVTTFFPNSWETRVTTEIEYASMELIPVGDMSQNYTVKIEAADGSVYKIDSMLTKSMDLEALQRFLFRAGVVTLIYESSPWNGGRWVLGIEADDVVFLDAEQSIRIFEHNDRLNLLFTIPFFTLVSLYFFTLGIGTNKIQSMFQKRRNNA